MPTKRSPAPAPTVSAGFPAQLREIISGRGLTAYSVARSAGVAPSVVSRFLSRERGLSLETFDAIAGALGLRLVEGGRGKGRPARGAGPPAATSDPGASIAVSDGVGIERLMGRFVVVDSGRSSPEDFERMVMDDDGAPPAAGGGAEPDDTPPATRYDAGADRWVSTAE